MNDDDIQAALHHQQQLEQQEQEECKVYRLHLAYCDYIADRIKQAMNGHDPEGIIVGAGSIKWDFGLKGELLSTKKHLFVIDKNRKTYKVTVEEI